MSAQTTITARDVNEAILDLRQRALKVHDDLRHFAAQCYIRREIQASEDNTDLAEHMETLRARAERRGAEAFEMVKWADEAYTDWIMGRLSPKELIGNVHMAHEMLTHIEHPAAGSAA